MPDWKNLKNKAMAAVNNAADTVDRQMAATKLRSAVTQAQAALDQEFQHLGKAVYAQLQTAETVSRADIAATGAADRIAARQQDLDHAQRAWQAATTAPTGGAEAGTCAQCGARLGPAAKFCPECGQAVSRSTDTGPAGPLGD